MRDWAGLLCTQLQGASSRLQGWCMTGLQNKGYSLYLKRHGAYLRRRIVLLPQNLRLWNLAQQLRAFLLGFPLLHTFSLKPESWMSQACGRGLLNNGLERFDSIQHIFMRSLPYAMRCAEDPWVHMWLVPDQELRWQARFLYCASGWIFPLLPRSKMRGPTKGVEPQ